MSQLNHKAAVVFAGLQGRQPSAARHSIGHASRGRYSSDASHHRIVPLSVVLRKDAANLKATSTMAREEK